MRAAPGLWVLGTQPPARAALQPTQPTADWEHKNIIISLITSTAEKERRGQAGGAGEEEEGLALERGKGLSLATALSPCRRCPSSALPRPGWPRSSSPTPQQEQPLSPRPLFSPGDLLPPHPTAGRQHQESFEPLQGCQEWAAPPRRAVAALWLGNPRRPALLPHPSTAQRASVEGNRARGMPQPQQ